MRIRRRSARHVRAVSLRRTALKLTVLLLASGTVAAGGVAQAFWTVPVEAGSAGSSSLASVGALPAAPTVAVSKDALTPSWPAATLSGGRAVTGYTLTRYDADDNPVAPTGGCAGLVTGTSCTEAGVPEGTWRYSVTPRVGSSWTGASSPTSLGAISDATAPRNTLSLTGSSGGASFLDQVAATVYFQGAVAGSVQIVNAVSDDRSGPAGSETGPLPVGSPFSHDASIETAPAGGPYVSHPINWAAGTSVSQALTVSGLDANGNRSDSTVTFIEDDSPPTGASVDYLDGTPDGTSVTVSYATGSDDGSGLGYHAVARQRSTLVDGTCRDDAGSPEILGDSLGYGPASSSYTDTGLVRGHCYTYLFGVWDRVTNLEFATRAAVVKVPSYADVVRSTPAIQNRWRLGEPEGTSFADDVADQSQQITSGTWFGDPGLRDPGAIANDADTAVSFDGVDDYGSIPRTVADDFSIEFWFRSTQGIGSDDRWSDGAGLVDGSVDGNADDFGISLKSDGVVATGTGNGPDSAADTVLDSAHGGFNDGRWHHVVVTRIKLFGDLVLYVDGVEEGHVSASTRSLDASADFTLGRIRSGGNYFRGSIDELAIYSTVLSADQVAAHYRAGRG